MSGIRGEGFTAEQEGETEVSFSEMTGTAEKVRRHLVKRIRIKS